MTRLEVIRKAMEKAISWEQAADICRITPRHMRRLRFRFEELGIAGVRDGRTGQRQPRRVPEAVEQELCRLWREVYPDFSTRHFHQFVTRRHGISLSETWTRLVLFKHGLVEQAPARGKHGLLEQAPARGKHGLVEQAPARGKHRRRRERRPMRGQMLHFDGSRHSWIAGLPQWDLMVMLDDADGSIRYARFVEEEGTLATLAALEHVLGRWGRFCEFYTDRGSHFCTTSTAGCGPDEEQHGQVARVMRTLGLRHIFARSPEARGRSERAFGTIQGRLPQELRLAGVTDYDAANRYLEEYFSADFNRLFTVEPAQVESAFTSLAGVSLQLLLTVQHQRVVQKDNTVMFNGTHLQLPASGSRVHFVRCPVLVHEFPDGKLGVSFQGTLLARFSRDGVALAARPSGRPRSYAHVIEKTPHSKRTSTGAYDPDLYECDGHRGASPQLRTGPLAIAGRRASF